MPAAPPGTRIEQTEVRFAAIEREIRHVIPADEIDMLIDNIGIPNSWTSHRPGRHPHHLQRRRRNPDLAEQGKARARPRDYEVLLRKRLQRKISRT